MAKAKTPRAFTKEEVQKKFLTTLANYVEYWATLPGKSERERVEGLAFSMLVILDGGAADLPGFSVTPEPHESDKDYHIERGENYFPTDVDIAGGLHEVVHKYFKKAPGDKALVAIKEFLEWGAKTGSDRDLFDDKFRGILNEAKIEFKEPEY